MLTGALLRRVFVATLVATAALVPLVASSAGATVIDGCTIVPNPTSSAHTDCRSMNLQGADFSGQDLSYATFLTDDLTSASFANANLSYAGIGNQSGAAGASFVGAIAAHACLCADVFTGADFTNADLTGAQLTSPSFEPAPAPVLAAGPDGAIVTWPTPPGLPGATMAGCNHVSGERFPVGWTGLRCGIADYRGPADANSYASVYVLPVPTTITATPAVATFAGPTLSAFQLSARLSRSDNGVALAGQPIRFTAGSATICTVETDAAGVATCIGVLSAADVVRHGGYTATLVAPSWLVESSTDAALSDSPPVNQGVVAWGVMLGGGDIYARCGCGGVNLDFRSPIGAPALGTLDAGDHGGSSHGLIVDSAPYQATDGAGTCGAPPSTVAQGGGIQLYSADTLSVPFSYLAPPSPGVYTGWIDCTGTFDGHSGSFRVYFAGTFTTTYQYADAIFTFTGNWAVQFLQ